MLSQSVVFGAKRLSGQHRIPRQGVTGAVHPRPPLPTTIYLLNWEKTKVFRDASRVVMVLGQVGLYNNNLWEWNGVYLLSVTESKNLCPWFFIDKDSFFFFLRVTFFFKNHFWTLTPWCRPKLWCHVSPPKGLRKWSKTHGGRIRKSFLCDAKKK